MGADAVTCFSAVLLTVNFDIERARTSAGKIARCWMCRRTGRLSVQGMVLEEHRGSYSCMTGVGMHELEVEVVATWFNRWS